MTLRRKLLLLYLKNKDYFQILFGYLFLFFSDYFLIFGSASFLLKQNYLIPNNNNDYILALLILLGFFALSMKKIIPEPVKNSKNPLSFKIFIGHIDMTKIDD